MGGQEPCGAMGFQGKQKTAVNHDKCAKLVISQVTAN